MQSERILPRSSEMGLSVNSNSNDVKNGIGFNAEREEDKREWDSVASSSESAPPSPSRGERRPLRVGFAAMEDNSDQNSNVNNCKKEINKDLSKFSRKGTGSVRYNQPRLSLLGKPINYKQHKNDIRCRRLQAKIYNFLERPKNWAAVSYHIFMFLLCLGALAMSTLSTITNFETVMTSTVIYLEPVLLFWLIVEYCFRVWSSGCRSRFQGCRGRFRFAQRPLCIVDLVIIVSTMIVILVGSASPLFAASTLRGLRFFQILRMVRIDRRAGTWKLLASVVWAHRQELLTTLYIGFLALLFSSFLVFLAEKDATPDRFGTYADALWWGVITLCTVGYGDVVPETWAGKIIAAFSAILGISFFALPAGILGSGFALKVQQQQRQKHLIRRRVPAAFLIQSLWRCYAADEHSMSIATWKPHMIPCPSPSTERPFKHNTSFVSRFSTRRNRSSHHNSSSSSTSNLCPSSPLIQRKDSKRPMINSEEEIQLPDKIPETLQRSHLSLATGLVDQRVDRFALMRDNSISSFLAKESEDDTDLSPKVRELTEVHKRAIRAIRKIRYFVARRKFREAFRPYDVKDVIEQYSAGHLDMLGRVKSLQSRIDLILGKAGSKQKDVYESKISLASRIVKVERQVEDVETKLDILIDLYKEDRKILLQYCQSKQEATPEGNDSSGKPRSILVDKQYTSEPSSPTAKVVKKPMQRNHSDLSSRIRKRVTYRLHSAPPNSIANSGSKKVQEDHIPEHGIPRSLSESNASRTTLDTVFLDDKINHTGGGGIHTQSERQHTRRTPVSVHSTGRLSTDQDTSGMNSEPAQQLKRRSPVSIHSTSELKSNYQTIRPDKEVTVTPKRKLPLSKTKYSKYGVPVPSSTDTNSCGSDTDLLEDTDDAIEIKSIENTSNSQGDKAEERVYRNADTDDHYVIHLPGGNRLSLASESSDV